MTAEVWITLIIAATVVVVLALYRGRLARFVFKASDEGVEAELDAQETDGGAAAPGSPGSRPSVVIRGTRQSGRKHKISVRKPDVEVSDVRQKGEEHQVEVGPDSGNGEAE